MAWQYALWEEQGTASARLTMLRQWRGELRAALTLGVTNQGHAVSSADIRQALKDSEDPLRRLEAEVAAENATQRPLAVTTRTRQGWH